MRSVKESPVLAGLVGLKDGILGRDTGPWLRMTALEIPDAIARLLCTSLILELVLINGKVVAKGTIIKQSFPCKRIAPLLVPSPP